jgi:mannitol/fructose-specific phosphotransferase system IIA component (Ntr-type)
MTRLAEISAEQVVLLQSRTKDEALRELVTGACRSIPGLDAETAFRAVWARETLVSSWVAPGIAMPHARLEEMEGFGVFVGCSTDGVDYEAADTRPVRLLVLILGTARAPERHLAVLADCARTLKEPGLLARVLAAGTQAAVAEVFRARAPEAATGDAGETRLILAHAAELADQVGATAILVQLSAVRPVSLLSELGTSRPVILVVEDEGMVSEASAAGREVLSVPFGGLDRSHQVSVTLFLALSRRLISRSDRVVALFGRTGSGTPDSLLVLDPARELPAFLPAYARSILGDVDIHVLERVLHIAVELAREGREGRSVGALFVVGDFEHVHPWSRQMVMNPFRGYAQEETNILDPSLSETVKEFCTIDGAFLIRGNGVIEAAGAHVRSERQPADIPGGLGARHAAAAAITAQTSAISVAVSQSTGRVSVYRSGCLLMVLERMSK